MDLGVVVPNRNGARWLRQCIDSILKQEVSGTRVLVMDGRSTDESVRILQGYGDRIAWVSERDEGQADAIDRGFRRLDTELVGWLNSDDELLPGSLEAVRQAATRVPDAVMYFGDVQRIDADGQYLGLSRAVDLHFDMLRRGKGKVLQPGSFYRASAVRRVGGVDKSFHALMDLDLWIRLLSLGPACRIDRPLARFRVHPDAKSGHYFPIYARETLRVGWRHERDRLLWATVRRSLRLGVHAIAKALGKR